MGSEIGKMLAGRVSVCVQHRSTRGRPNHAVFLQPRAVNSATGDNRNAIHRKGPGSMKRIECLTLELVFSDLGFNHQCPRRFVKRSLYKKHPLGKIAMTVGKQQKRKKVISSIVSFF